MKHSLAQALVAIKDEGTVHVPYGNPLWSEVHGSVRAPQDYNNYTIK